jgi:hypothetical protein
MVLPVPSFGSSRLCSVEAAWGSMLLEPASLGAAGRLWFPIPKLARAHMLGGSGGAVPSGRIGLYGFR